MKYLNGKEREDALQFVDKAMKIAQASTCLRIKCGSVIVMDGGIIGEGFNSPAGSESQRCLNNKEDYDKKVTDKTCCVHAEQRAIIDALRKNPEKIRGARLYFIRLDEKGDKVFAGKPYCTICSKMVLDVGIKEFVLWHESGICVYDAEEYNNLSYDFQKDI